MEINLNKPMASAPLATTRPTTGPVKKTAADATEFSGADALNQALAATPDTRAEVIARGKKLAADPAYPPAETIKRIANLLASKIDQTEA